MNILLKKELKKRKFSLAGIFVLFVIISLSLISALSTYLSTSDYIQSQMERLGFGDMTVWIHENENSNDLIQEINSIDDVEEAVSQPLIYAGYSIHESHSDDEGQLLAYDPLQYDYCIFNQYLNGYQENTSIQSGEIYITPAMHSMYDISLGDEISFDIARQGTPQTFIVSGYFEDPFMGSSMIDMKSFLICQSDFNDLTQVINNTSDFNELAKNGAMIHIFQNENSSLTQTQFHQIINNETGLTDVIEFVYSESSIYGFMMILQDMFTGFLSAFAVILLVVSMIVIGYGLSHTIDLEKKDIGILKTIGFQTMDIRTIQIMQYMICIITAILLSVLVSPFIIKIMFRIMITSNGLLIPVDIPYILIVLLFVLVLLIIVLFIYLKTEKMKYVSPIQTIQQNNVSISKKQMKLSVIYQRGLLVSLAFRQLLSDKKRYIGTFTISLVLVLFLSIIGRINTWIGPNGEGLMDAFSVADHDLGVQPLTQFNMEEVDDLILHYATIEDTYQLAMQSVSIESVDYTANVIDNPSLLHIISGKTPEAANEIVITEYVANDLGIDIGHEVHITYQNQQADYVVVGIYQCANEMGANIAMNVDGFERIGSIQGYIWCKHYILSSHTQNEQIMKDLQNRYPMDLAVHTNSWSGLDGIIQAMHLLTYAMYGVAAMFIIMTVLLIGSQILHFQQRDMSILKSIGFQTYELRLFFALKFAMIVFIGAIFGMILGMFISDPIISLLVQYFGIGEFYSSITWISTLIPVGIVTVFFTVFAYISSYKLKNQTLIALLEK